MQELRGKTIEFKERLDKGETLDDLLVEAYAVVRETSGAEDAGTEAFSGSAFRWNHFASGAHCGDEDRRG